MCPELFFCWGGKLFYFISYKGNILKFKNEEMLVFF